MTAPHSLRVLGNELEHHVLEWPARPEVSGEPRRSPTVFLVHGFMDAAGTWDLVAPRLASRGFRVLAPDMRGFGGAPRAARGSYYHFADYVFDLADVVDALCPLEPVAVVGHSMGGVIATLFAGTFPERVTRLAVLEGAGPPDNPWEAGPQRMRRWIDQVRASRAQAAHASGAGMTRDEALKRLTVNHPQVATSVLESRLAALADSRQDGVSVRYKWCFDPVHRTTSPTPFFAKLFVEFAKRVTCPVLFVSGGPTGYHTPDEADRILAFHECAVCELHNAGHMMHWTQPEALSDGLLKHLGSLPEICDTP